MVRNSRLTHRKASAQSPTPDFCLPRDVLEDLEPPRISQCFGYSLKLIGVQGLP